LYDENKSLYVGVAGPYDAFSPQYNWVTPRYLAIDQGTIAPMIENYRTGLLWNLFMNAAEIKPGLVKLGFHSENIILEKIKHIIRYWHFIRNSFLSQTVVNGKMKIEIVEKTRIGLCVAYSVKYQGKETFDCFAWFGEKKVRT
jgi:hypothetical protein